jgi:hypothetical protein
MEDIERYWVKMTRQKSHYGSLWNRLELHPGSKSAIRTEIHQKHQLEAFVRIEAIPEAGREMGRERRWSESANVGGPEREDERLLALNRRLREIGPLNESILEALLTELGERPDSSPARYWLTAARIFELALECLGDYVDACEFTAAGDLLANPRRVEVHVRGEDAPRAKRRHGSLLEIFPDDGERNRAEAVGWLRRNACVRIIKPALLPELFGRLRRSGWLTGDYLESGDRRMKRAASAMAFLWAGRWNAETFWSRLRGSDPAERRWLESRLCRFDRSRFDAMGIDMERMGREPGFFGDFLRKPPVSVSGTVG